MSILCGRSGKLIAAAAGVLVMLLVSAPMADAHEVAVAIVVTSSPAGSEVDARAILDGLRLAIDQSPDVGHAPGPNSGDHLGGVDVELIDLGSVAPAVAGASVLSSVTDGATIVVVIGDADAIALVAKVVPQESALAIAVLTGPDDAGVSLPASVLRTSPILNADAVGALSEAFEATYGRELSESAGIGYDVGQLLDVLLAESDGALPDATVLNKASATALARLNFTTIDRVDEPRSGNTQSPLGDSPDRDRSRFLPILLVGIGIVVSGVLATRIRRQRSRFG